MTTLTDMAPSSPSPLTSTTVSGPEPAVVTDAEPAVVTDAEREVGIALDRALGRLLRWNRRKAPATLGPGVLSALGTVVDHGSLRLGDLAAREGIAPASLTRVIAVLEQHSLLARSVDPQDRRSMFVAATPAGASMIHDLRRERGEGLAARLAPLAPAQLSAMHDIVRAIDDLTSIP